MNKRNTFDRLRKVSLFEALATWHLLSCKYDKFRIRKKRFHAITGWKFREYIIALNQYYNRFPCISN